MVTGPEERGILMGLDISSLPAPSRPRKAEKPTASVVDPKDHSHSTTEPEPSKSSSNRTTSGTQTTVVGAVGAAVSDGELVGLSLGLELGVAMPPSRILTLDGFRVDTSTGPGVGVWRVGVSVFATEGAFEGNRLGLMLGDELGEKDGDVFGLSLGTVLGLVLGNELGEEDGALLGLSLGPVVGFLLGNELGAVDGAVLRLSLGPLLGTALGPSLGASLGTRAGCCVGLSGVMRRLLDTEGGRVANFKTLGISEGAALGELLGIPLGSEFGGFVPASRVLVLVGLGVDPSMPGLGPGV